MHLTAAALLTLCPALQDSAVEEEDDTSLLDGAILMDRARGALANPGRLADVENRRYRGRASWVGLEMSGTFEETFAGPRRALLVTEFEGFGRVSLGVHDDLIWEHHPGGARVKRGWEANADLRQYGILQHVDWRYLYASARLTGEETLAGRRCQRLQLAPRALVAAPEGFEPAPDVWWLDAETLLPARIAVWMNDAAGKALPRATLTLSRWKLVDNIQYPQRREIEVNDFTLVLDYESIEHDVELPAELFEPGDEVRAAAAQPGPGQPDAVPEIAIEELKEVHTATIRVSARQEDLQKTFSVIFPEVFRYVLSTGNKTGVVFARFHQVPGEGVERFDIEGGIQLEAPIEPEGRVEATRLPAGKAVVAWHVGPYHSLPETHARMVAWMEERGYEVAGPFWEEYWTDPGLEPDPAKLRTRVVQPVRAKQD